MPVYEFCRTACPGIFSFLSRPVNTIGLPARPRCVQARVRTHLRQLLPLSGNPHPSEM